MNVIETELTGGTDGEEDQERRDPPVQLEFDAGFVPCQSGSRL